MLNQLGVVGFMLGCWLLQGVLLLQFTLCPGARLQNIDVCQDFIDGLLGPCSCLIKLTLFKHQLFSSFSVLTIGVMSCMFVNFMHNLQALHLLPAPHVNIFHLYFLVGDLAGIWLCDGSSPSSR